MDEETKLLIEAAEDYASIWNDEEDRCNIKNAFLHGHKYAKKNRWKDISSVPQDRKILLFYPDHSLQIGYWSSSHQRYIVEPLRSLNESNPVYWQELPEKPGNDY